MKPRILLLSAAVLTLAACGFDSHELRGWTLPPNHQSIDLNVDHWTSFVFSEGATTVMLNIPANFRTFHVGPLPQATFDKYSQRSLLLAEYDYRSKSIEELAQFQIRASFLRLADPLPTTDIGADSLNRAMRSAEPRPPPNNDDPIPALVALNGREWIHIDNSDSKFGGSTSESYGTLIDSKTVFVVSASYLQDIRKDPAWFESRRNILQSIRDGVTLAR